MKPLRLKVLILACGALARELVQIRRLNGWESMDIRCLPATLHNTPEQIPGAVREVLQNSERQYDSIFVAYADCGTGGRLDAVLAEFGVERLPGAHCYEFFAGTSRFEALSDEEPGTFYLTDFLLRHFDRLVIESLGLDRHPELRDTYFGNYRRLVYLDQSGEEELTRQAEACAQRLGLEFTRVHTGLGPLKTLLREPVGSWLS